MSIGLPEKQLFDAAKNGDAELCLQALEKGAFPAARCFDDQTPMHFAAKAGHFEIINLLAMRGAPVNVATVHGNTPLHCAAFNGKSQCCIELLLFGAESNAKNNDGETALDFAKCKGHYELVELLDRFKGLGSAIDDCEMMSESIPSL